MNKKKSVDGQKYLLVFLMTLVVFMLGLYVGGYLTDKKLDSLDALQNRFRAETLGTEIQFDLVAENLCAGMNYSSLNEELYALSEKLDFMESRLGTEDEGVLMLKEYHSLLQLRHWLLLKRMNEDCAYENQFIIYFYSNKGDCPSCENQGNVLTYMRKNHDNLFVYPFDINIQNPALKALKEMFRLTEETPTLIIGDEVYTGYMDRSSVEAELEKQYPTAFS